MVSYIKVRLAQCVRKLGRVKEAIKIYREVLYKNIIYCVTNWYV